ncbi:hypothetical protein OWR29_08310 [Actinoplanes sp. Pm04-4]|uniref:Uncharacterized protein n=1 Tax=Paractinoplanes pyxinae TaxID=2997416 RepID=A0ABT4AVV5_9ACTN|nr:hypothetical protein [Actinoplanes pyxinae]MCY1137997.1 hypothetical protein [Actinoplanes pyxinae]
MKQVDGELSAAEEQHLRSSIHHRADAIELSGDGWQRIAERTRGRKAGVGRRFLVPATAALGVILAVVAGVTVRRSDSNLPTVAPQQGAIIWPQDLVGGKGETGPATGDPGPTAERFLDELGVPTSDLTFAAERDSSDGARLVKVTTRDGSVLGTVSLRWDAGGGAWGVQAMQSPRTTVRNPEPNGAVNPPLSVAFRTDADGTARVRLLDARNSKELTTWSEGVDSDVDWQANANFTRETKPFPGYLVLTVRDDGGRFTSVVVMPLTIGAS